MAVVLLSLLAANWPIASRADSLTPPFVTDPLTGVALDGYDPVSYFTDPEPLPGKPDYEYDWGGVPWYFANGANRDVFRLSPTTYAPQFGGHATTALGQGYLSDGNPQIYLVVADRLYLFYSLDTRNAFLQKAATNIASARTNWDNFSKRFAAVDPPAGPPHPATPSP